MLSRIIVAVAAAFAAGGALAQDVQPILSGDLSLAIGTFRYGGSGYGTVDTLARVNKPLVPLSNVLNLEVEAGGGAAFSGGDSQPLYVDAVAHLWGMHSPSKALGVFGGGVFAQGSVIGILGVEGKHYLSNGAFGGSAAVLSCGYCGGGLGLFTATFDHYLTPNRRVGLRGAFLTDFSGESYWEVGADFEHRFTHPWAMFAGVSYLGGNGPSGAWIGRLGARFYIDQPGDTVQSHDMKVPWTVWIPSVFAAGA